MGGGAAWELLPHLRKWDNPALPDIAYRTLTSKWHMPFVSRKHIFKQSCCVSVTPRPSKLRKNRQKRWEVALHESYYHTCVSGTTLHCQILLIEHWPPNDTCRLCQENIFLNNRVVYLSRHVQVNLEETGKNVGRWRCMRGITLLTQWLHLLHTNLTSTDQVVITWILTGHILAKGVHKFIRTPAPSFDVAVFFVC